MNKLPPFLLILLLFSFISAQETKISNHQLFVDERDKKQYKIVKFGAQIWMAENLKFRPANTNKFWCYDDDEKNCEKYGVLYSWEAAIESCPQGWRMPSAQDWNDLQTALEKTVKEDKQFAEIGKILLDEKGFNAVFAGFRLDSGRFLFLDSHAIFWSNEIDTTDSEVAQKFGRYFGRHLYTEKSAFKFEPSRGKPDVARSLRCIQN